MDRGCSLLLGVDVDSSGNGPVAGASAAAQSPWLPQIIGLPTMLHVYQGTNLVS